MGEQATVLVVEDDADVRDLYRLWLSDEYTVRTAADGESGIETISDEVAVALLDRNLPGMDGDALAQKLRSEGYEGAIAMVTANAPDPSIAMLPIDEYVTKPVDGTDVTALVDRLLTRLDVPADRRRLFAMLTRRIRLEDTISPSELSDNDAYRELTVAIERQYRLTTDSEKTAQEIVSTVADTLPVREDADDAMSYADQSAAPMKPGQEF